MHKIFSRQHSKKGSLSLSINAIVVLILAITMLGLGLAFIRGLFGGAVGKLQEIYAGLSEEDKKTLEASQEEISFLQSDIKVSGREVTTPFAIRNIRADKIGLRIKNNFYCFDAIGVPKLGTPNNQLANNVLNQAYLGQAGGVVSVDTAKIETDIRGQNGLQIPPTPWISFLTYDDRDIPNQKADVLPLTIRVAAGAPATTFSCAFAPVIIRTVDSSGRFLALMPGTNGFDIYATKYFNIVYTK